jgi:heme/copper-type cytochrome/quinol oxidase subunit 1
MKPFEFAIIGVRLVALGIISFGAVLLSGGMLQRAVMSGSIAGTATVDLHLQDTYYVIAHNGFDLFGPGGTSLLIGALLMIASRRLARWLAYDFEKF